MILGIGYLNLINGYDFVAIKATLNHRLYSKSSFDLYLGMNTIFNEGKDYSGSTYSKYKIFQVECVLIIVGKGIKIPLQL